MLFSMTGFRVCIKIATAPTTIPTARNLCSHVNPVLSSTGVSIVEDSIALDNGVDVDGSSYTEGTSANPDNRGEQRESLNLEFHVDTFFRNVQFSTFDDGDGVHRSTSSASGNRCTFNLSNNFHAFDYFAEDDMFSIQPAVICQSSFEIDRTLTR
jgi:hypothetical protein